MSVRIPWDKFESAILLEAVIEVTENKISRVSAIAQVSSMLRNMALNKGMAIDSIFRNVNGISMQFSIMESLYTCKPSGLHSGSKLFYKTVETYKTNYDAFMQVLMEAKKMCSAKQNNKKLFLAYIVQKEPRIAGDIYYAMDRIEQYAIQKNLFQCSFYDILSEETVNILYKQIIHDTQFRKRNDKILHYIRIGLSLLKNYVKTNKDLVNALNTLNAKSDNTSSVELENTPKTQHIITMIPDSSEATVDEVKNIGSVNSLKNNPFFNQKSFALNLVEDIEDVSLSNPNQLYIFDKTINVTSWANLFINFLAEANRKYSTFLDFFYKKQLTSRNRRLVKSDEIKLLKRPLRIPDTLYYVETNITALGLLRAVQRICKNLKIKLSDVYISYSGTIKFIVTHTEIESKTNIIENKNTIDQPSETIENGDELTKIESKADNKTIEAAWKLDSAAASVLLKDNDVDIDIDIDKNAVDDESDTLQVDFNNAVSYAFTKPVFLSFYGVNFDRIYNWTHLYVEFMKILVMAFPNKIKSGLCLYEEGRIDVGSDEYRSSMKTPKEISANLFLETNLSATSIIKKIKCALDLCNISYDFIEIHYVKIKEEKKSEQKSSNLSDAEIDPNHPFYRWMIDEYRLSPLLAKGYLKSVYCAEKIAKLQRLTSWKLISTENYNEALETYKLLCENNLFGATNRKSYFNYTTAINKFLCYLKKTAQIKPHTASTDAQCQLNLFDRYNTEPEFDENVINSFKALLNEKFSKGFRLSSPIELRKFKAWYEEVEHKKFDESDEQLKKYILHCGIEYDDKLYLVENLLSNEIKDKLFSYIEKTFAAGIAAIFYDALYEKFHEDFSCERIFDSTMLKRYLMATLKGKYYFSRSYFSKNVSANVNIEIEIRNCLLKHGTPVLTEVIYSELSHIPQDKIRQALQSNKEFIRNSKGEYFHYSLVILSDGDLDKITTLIQTAINEKEYISGNELLNAIQKKYSYIMEDNEMFSNLGLRSAIAYYLRGRFSFDSNVISQYGKSLSMGDVYADFSKSRETFTIDELKLLKSEIQSGVIYFDYVYQNALRISKDKFVSKRNVRFDVTSTDAAIDMFLNEKDYIPLKGITGFGSFPDAGFSWNIFLLEHYVAEFSKKFKLIHSTYNENSCVGAIVKKSAAINSLDELISIVLANSNINLNESSSLEYLYNEGYIAMRKFKGITSALIKAKEIRNKKGNK